MSASLIVRRAGPSVTLQDFGRPGQMASGLSCGGAADRTALIEGAVLLGQNMDCAALEMAGFGGEFEASADISVALTGAPMQASLDGEVLVWNASHAVKAGQRLSIGACTSGNYGYLNVGGGFASPSFLNSRAAHLAAGIGKRVEAGDTLPVGVDENLGNVGQKLPPDPRFNGGNLRVLPSVQTSSFTDATLARFEETPFKRSPRGNRQGAELTFDGAPFTSGNQLVILSEPMIAGDIQMTGDGFPFVLLPECQTTGGYPRIATVLPDDLPLVAQASGRAELRFRFIDHAQAVTAHRPLQKIYADLKRKVQPLLRDPHEMRDLLSYQLISGMITGRD